MTARSRILIVDDERIVCDRLGAEMERLGLEVETCLDSSDALARIAERAFSLVITDIKMRGPTGIDIMHFVRENHPATRVIVITGFATSETAQEALRGGAVEFIPKPFKMRTLRDVVLRLLGPAHENGGSA